MLAMLFGPHCFGEAVHGVYCRSALRNVSLEALMLLFRIKKKQL